MNDDEQECEHEWEYAGPNGLYSNGIYWLKKCKKCGEVQRDRVDRREGGYPACS